MADTTCKRNQKKTFGKIIFLAIYILLYQCSYLKDGFLPDFFVLTNEKQ